MHELNNQYIDNAKFENSTEVGSEEFNSKPIFGSHEEFVVGNVTKPIKIIQNPDFSEIRADIQVKNVKTIRIWGQIRDCNDLPVKNALLKLVREVKGCDNKLEYVGIAHGVTDCLGFYQFDVCVPNNSVPAIYRIFVSKQALGKEVYMNLTECDPCKDEFTCAK